METIRLFDAFLFAEPHETELLLAKLHVESELVEAWVVVENSYTPKGAWKGTCLQGILDADRRFDPFRDRLHVVTLDRNFRAEFRRASRGRLSLAFRTALPGYDAAAYRTRYAEAPNWFAEGRQRDAALPVVRELGGGDGWVLATDCDEMLDASNPVRRDALVRAVRSGAPSVSLRRQRFNYDFDNYCPALRFVQGASVRHLDQQGLGIDDVRKRLGGVGAGPEACVYEYSYCFDRAHIERKLATFPHLDPGTSTMHRALDCNHAMFAVRPSWVDPAVWYERIPLEQTGAPGYVLEHFERLRTGVVGEDYAANRRRHYPGLFSDR
ncbi:MAG: hypothetical protein WDA60_01860 [Acidimicrobiia bacterium]